MRQSLSAMRRCSAFSRWLLLAIAVLFAERPTPSASTTPSCGERSLTTPLIAGGEDAAEGQFPWSVAVFRAERGDVFEQICGGTLIAPRFVVSAAHCFYSETHRRLEGAGRYRVAVGRTDRTWRAGADVATQLRVAELQVPRFFYGSKSQFSHDIALLRLAADAPLGDNIACACVDWTAAQTSWTTLDEAKEGVVAGWGGTNNQTRSDALKWATLPLVPNDECAEYLRSNAAAHKLTADRLCAGHIGRSISVCRGDSGSGLVTYHAATERFYLRGVTSISLSTGPDLKPGVCRSQDLAGFTDVAAHIAWIKTVVAVKERLGPKGVLDPEDIRPAGYERLAQFGSYKLHEELRDWTQAVATCRHEGGYLLVLRSVAEYNALRDKYAARLLHGQYYGAHHRKEFHKFVTIFDEPLEDTGYTVWQTGYPGAFDNVNYPVLRLETSDTATGLAVEKDWERRPFICKWKPRPAGYERLGLFGIYKLHEELRTWAQAVATCRRERAYLLVLRSVAEYNALRDKYAARLLHGQYYGAHHRKEFHKFVTIFDEPLERTNYTVWQTGYPGEFDNVNYPVLRLEMSDTATGLAVEKDWELRPFICKVDLP